LLSAFWAWHLASDGTTCNLPPHRDGSGVTVNADGMPESLTVWIALTDATPDNGCIYVLPSAYDPFYGLTPSRVNVLDVQNVRALPTPAGTALAWNHQLLHWGGRTNSRAQQSLVSVAFEFRRAGAVERMKTLDPNRVPTFRERLKLIAEQIIRHKQYGGVEDRFVDLAARLLA
jgi:ectoine hydroxylase-related dioxygenase (phytanoyl-CoA dioxygenase family)